MNAPQAHAPKLGERFDGGHYTGRILVDRNPYALICAPAAVGLHVPAVWNKSLRAVEGARSFCDGFANTEAMAAAGSAIAKWARSLRIDGRDDWYLPSRDELEMLYRAFKPSTQKNWCWRGDNPSSIPVGYAYTPTDPAQTALEEFRTGGPEAFAEELHWSSTQYAGNAAYAWAQYFGDGNQTYCHKGSKFPARAVRRSAI